MYDTYKINEGIDERVALPYLEVQATKFVTNGDFVDFLDAQGEANFRIRADQIITIERLDPGYPRD